MKRRDLPIRFQQPGRRAWVAYLILGLAAAPAQAQAPDFGALSRYVERERASWGIPGLAMAVVKDDSVVFARGFGVRDLRTGEPVDEATVFAIGSASKAFTAAAVATLVDEGRLRWNDPATLHLPTLELFDPYVTRELTVVDLLSHRSGLPRGDQIWYGTGFDRDEVIRRVRYLEPQSSFRSAFGYQNIMFIAAGQLVPALTGMSWDAWIRERIFQPLGMTSSNTSVRDLEGMANVATPHQEVDGEVIPIGWRDIDNAGPAGSINSNVLDMARWVRMHLAEGRMEDRAVISAEAVAAMQAHRTILRREGSWALMTPASEFMTYGLGWFMSDYRGRMVVQHGGNIDGMHALVGMVPEEELGVVVLTNLNNALTYALLHRIIDLYLGDEATDWSARLRSARDSLAARGRESERTFEADRAPGTAPSLPLADYAAAYTHVMYGDLRVSAEEDRLVLRRGEAFVGDLEHWHHDTFKVVWRDRALGVAYVTFVLGDEGKVTALEIPGMGAHRRLQGEGS